MTYRKKFRVTQPDSPFSPLGGPRDNNQSGMSANFGYKNYQSLLPDVYSGHPNRLDRYQQMEQMDLDPEVNAALDTIADFCTQVTEETSTAFTIKFSEDPTASEADILATQLKQWWSLNEFDKRITKMVRNVLKYGDQVFIRDPETFELYWVDMIKLTKIVVNESQGKLPEQYFFKDLSPNFENLTATATGSADPYMRSPQTGGATGAYTMPASAYTSGSRFQTGVNETPVEAKHVVHASLTEGLDANWPFGVSILENVFKVFKQKELLEDAVLIYRIQRAPERRVFYIDVGTQPAHIAMQFVERVKNEIHQRRIPTQTGGGGNIMDATYNPLSISEDYFFPQSAEGRGSRVETLPGGESLGQIDDLKFFSNRLLRGLRIPSSYLPSGPDDGTQSFNDGKVTTALIQEFRFNEYCKKIQKLIAGTFDNEFKMFLSHRGFQLDNSLFEIRFNEPMNFASYRVIDLDQARIGNFGAISAVPHLSKRFVLKKYLGLTDIEMKENEKLWREEQGKLPPENATGEDLRNVGVTPGGISSDMDTMDMALDGEDGMDPMNPGSPGDLGLDQGANTMPNDSGNMGMGNGMGGGTIPTPPGGGF